MDAFALNAAAVNGQDYEVIELEGSASMTLGVSGQGIRGAMLAGEHALSLVVTGDVYRGLMASGAVDAGLDAALSPMLRTFIAGDITLDMDGDMVGAAGILGQGEIGLFYTASHDLTRRAMAQGAIPMSLSVDFEARVQGKVNIEGQIGMVLDPWLNGRRTQAHRPAFPLAFNLGLEGAANLEMHDVSGVMALALDADGDARLGGRVAISGDTSMALLAYGEARRYALVHLAGDTELTLDMIAMTAGRPLLPVEYVPSPRSRLFHVPAERRARHVTHQERRL